MTLKTIAAAGAALLLAAVTAVSAPAQDIKIEHQYARAASPVAKSGGAFMHIMNTGTEDDRLIAVRTDVARKPQIHNNIIEDGVAKMREVEGGLVIPAGDAVMLQRGGYHIMLIGLNAPLVQDETITLTLVFEKAGEITIEVPVDYTRKDDAGMMEHDMEGMEGMEGMGEHGEGHGDGHGDAGHMDGMNTTPAPTN